MVLDIIFLVIISLFVVGVLLAFAYHYKLPRPCLWNPEEPNFNKIEFKARNLVREDKELNTN